MKCRSTAVADPGCLKQVSTGEQFNSSPVIGFNIQGNVVPVFYNINMGGGRYETGPIYYGKRYHDCFLYDDLAYSACCRAVFWFNVEHYTKCYLPGTLGRNGRITAPYMFNNCKMCGSSIEEDGCPRMAERKWSMNWTNSRMVQRACEIRQEDGCCDEGYPARVDEEEKEVYTGTATINTLPITCREEN